MTIVCSRCGGAHMRMDCSDSVISRDLFAWTETEYDVAPAFINVTKVGRYIRLIVRSSGGEGYAEIYLPFNEARQLIDFLMISIPWRA